MIRKHPEFKDNLWTIVHALQSGFRKRGFDIGGTLSPVTPVYMKGGVDEACNIVVDLRETYNLFCSVVVYPVIPRGEIILRIIPRPYIRSKTWSIRWIASKSAMRNLRTAITRSRCRTWAKNSLMRRRSPNRRKTASNSEGRRFRIAALRISISDVIVPATVCR